MKALFRPEVVESLTRQKNNVIPNHYEPSLFQVIIFVLIFILSLQFIL